jgi:flavin reductase (DIM6/NTAB) family NADH-FMN oxidoreductase RutF
MSAKMPATKTFPPFVHCFPAPAVLIGCGTVSEPNLITCSWFGTVCSEPPMVSVSVRGGRYSYGLIHRSREFTVNVPRVTDLAAVKHCGAVSGRSTNKFADLGWTPVACPPLNDAPRIAECSLVIACRVRHELELGSHHLFVADVLAVHGLPRSEAPADRPDFFVTEQLVYLDGKFWTLIPAPPSA